MLSIYNLEVNMQILSKYLYRNIGKLKIDEFRPGHISKHI
jgi:hypothetical protein